MSRDRRILARVTPRREPPFDRLFDPLVDDLIRRGPLARERFPTPWSDSAALTDLTRAKRARLPGALAEALLATHRRLQAPPASLSALDRLARGEAVCAVAGQQPGPLGGPLYTLHKIASTVGLAEVVTERTGVPCIPLFWMHGEDSDFAEIRSVALATRTLELREASLSESAHRDAQLVGDLPVSALAEAHARALPTWAELPCQAEARARVEAADACGRDLGEAHAALMLALFGHRGLVVVDPRTPAFRDAATGVIARYLERAEALTEAARAAGERLEAGLGRRPLADAALESFVFAIEDGARRKLRPEEARRRAASVTLSPSVALRPVVQDAVFPTVAMACGAAEISYLAQLREVFQGLDVRPASPVPRLTATWLPPAARTLLEASGADPWALVAGTDHVVHDLAERAVPAEVRAELESLRTQTFRALEGFSASSVQVDASLPQLVESVRGKVDFQLSRLLEALTAKARHRLDRQHPEWARLRYYLLPGERLQERRLAALEPVAYRGAAAVDEVCDLAADQARRLLDGVHEHLLLEL